MPKGYTAAEKRQLEQKHADGYARKPVEPGEFDLCEEELEWGDE
jgi:hypothetical protein